MAIKEDSHNVRTTLVSATVRGMSGEQSMDMLLQRSEVQDNGNLEVRLHCIGKMLLANAILALRASEKARLNVPYRATRIYPLNS